MSPTPSHQLWHSSKVTQRRTPHRTAHRTPRRPLARLRICSSDSDRFVPDSQPSNPPSVPGSPEDNASINSRFSPVALTPQTAFHVRFMNHQTPPNVASDVSGSRDIEMNEDYVDVGGTQVGGVPDDMIQDDVDVFNASGGGSGSIDFVMPTIPLDTNPNANPATTASPIPELLSTDLPASASSSSSHPIPTKTQPRRMIEIDSSPSPPPSNQRANSSTSSITASRGTDMAGNTAPPTSMTDIDAPLSLPATQAADEANGEMSSQIPQQPREVQSQLDLLPRSVVQRELYYPGMDLNANWDHLANLTEQEEEQHDGNEAGSDDHDEEEYDEEVFNEQEVDEEDDEGVFNEQEVDEEDEEDHDQEHYSTQATQGSEDHDAIGSDDEDNPRNTTDNLSESGYDADNDQSIQTGGQSVEMNDQSVQTNNQSVETKDESIQTNDQPAKMKDQSVQTDPSTQDDNLGDRVRLRNIVIGNNNIAINVSLGSGWTGNPSFSLNTNKRKRQSDGDDEDDKDGKTRRQRI